MARNKSNTENENPILENELVETTTAEVVEGGNIKNKPAKKSEFNLLGIAKLPSEVYQFNNYSGRLELVDFEVLNLGNYKIKEAKNKNSVLNGKHKFVLAVANPTNIVIDENEEKIDDPVNKAKITSLPLSSLKSALGSSIINYFRSSVQILDKRDNSYKGEKHEDYFKIKSFFEFFAFAYCVTPEDILEPLKQKAKVSDSIATVNRNAREVVKAIKNPVIGATQFPITAIFHVPFYLEDNTVPDVITLELLQETYQKIINRQ